MHYDGTEWSYMKSGTQMWLRGVWGTSAADVFAVGENGTILHYDGLTWSSMEGGTSQYLHGIWGSSGENVYAIGDNGTIINYNGMGWSSVTSGTSEHLRAIWGSSATDIFVVGDNSTVLHYDGTGWSPMNSGTTAYLLGVWGSSGKDVFAVGGYYDESGRWYNGEAWDEGVILHYDGRAWTEMKNDVPERLLGIWGSSATDVFAVGAYGTILRHDGEDGNTGCAVETIYGEDSGETILLRKFRDDVLSKTPEGRNLIKLYYRWSPVIIKAMREDQEIKKEMKGLVNGILPLIQGEVR